MEYELRELGNRIMSELHKEWKEAVDDGGLGGDPIDNSYDVLDGMNNIELLAVLYVTANVGEAFEAVTDDVAECVRNRTWAFQ